MTRLFKRLVLRWLMAVLAAGFLFACGISATAYAAVNGSSTASGGKSGAAPGRSGTPAPAQPPATSNGSGASRSNAVASGRTAPQGGPGAQGGSGSPASDNSANGNKGHIQIEGAWDCGITLCGQDNDPHVDGCTLTVELFGYPSGTNSADLTIAGQAPSGTATVLTDSYTFTGASSPDGSILDPSGTRTYTLTASQLAGLTPQPQQGYHLRVDVAVNGFHAKTHVIWLDCTPPASSGSAGLAGTRGLSPAAPVSAAVPDGAAAPDSTAPVDAPDAAAMPLSAVTAARGDTVASGGLAFTGFDALMAIAAGVVLLLLGLSVVVLSRRGNRVGV